MKTRLNNSAFISLDLLVAVVLVLVVLMLALQIIPALNPPVPETNMKQVLTATRASDMLIGDQGWRASYNDPYWEKSWNTSYNASRIGFAFAGSSQNILGENKVSALMYKHPNDTPATWWNNSWLYRERIIIKNNNNTLALYDNYSISITLDTASLIKAGKMLPNGSDLRITYRNETSGEVELDRVNETDFNTPSTEIWFRTQKPIPNGTTDNNYSVYYGNPNAGSPPANKSKIYSLWEPFDNWNNWTNWTNGISQPEVSLSNGTINISNKDWTKRKQITINGSSTPLADYTVMLNVTYDGDMQIDFSDLRFTNATGAEISYWIENKVNSSYADVWVKVPSIPASSNSTIHMYYGNPNAVSQSNGTKTFDFFDDFEDGIADGWTLDGWSVQNIGGNYVLRATSNNLSSSPTFTEMNSLIAEYRFKYPNKTGSIVFNMSKPGNTAHFTHVDDIDGQYDIRVPTEDAANTIVDNNWTFDNGWHATKLAKNGTFYQQWLDEVDKGSNTSPSIFNVSQIWVRKKGVSWAYNECEAEQNTTSATLVDACTLTFNADAGDYIIAVAFELGQSNIDGGATASAALNINGTQYGNIVYYGYNNASQRYNMGWVKKLTFSGDSQTIKVQYNNSGGTAYIQGIHIFAWKAPTFQYTEADASQNFNNTETTLANLTFTPASAQNYLILASFENQGDWATLYMRLKVDGTVKNSVDWDSVSQNLEYRGHALMLVQNLTAASHTIVLTGQTLSGTTRAARNVRIAAIPLGSLTTYNSSDETQTSTSSTTYTDKLTYSPTISATGDHIIFASSELNHWAGGAPGGPTTPKYNNLLINSVQYQEAKDCIVDSNASAAWPSFFAVKKLSLTSGSNTFKIQHKTSSASYPVNTKNARITVIQMPPVGMDGYFDDFRVRKYAYPEPNATIGEGQDIDAGLYHRNFSFNSSEGFLIKQYSRSMDWEGHAFAYWLANISNISGTPRITSAYFARDGIMAYLSKRNGTSLENISVNLSFQIPRDWYTYEVFRKEDGGMRVLRNGTPLNISLGWVYDTNLTGNNLAFGRWGDGSSEYDWLLVRKYLDPEPSTSLDFVEKWLASAAPWWEYPVSSSSEEEKDNASRALGLRGYNFYMQLRPLNESLFNEVRANINITRNMPESRAAVVERYVFIRGSDALVNTSGKTAGYRLILWVW